MDLRQLEMFLAIVEAGSFTAAGDKLYVSQSAVSRQIALLEEELGGKVFKRVHRKTLLTPVGEVLLRHARKVYHDLREASVEVSEVLQLRRGSLRLGGGMSVSSYLFPPLLKQYRALNPQIEISIAVGTNEEILRQLRANSVDLALLSLPFTDPDLAVTPAVEEEMVLVTERNHPLSRKRKIRARDVAPYPFINFEPGSNTRKVITSFFEQEGVNLHNSMEIENVEIIRRFVEIGLGVAILPLQSIAVDARRSRAVWYSRFTGRKITRQMGWVHLRSDFLPATMREMLRIFDEMRPLLYPSSSGK